MLEDDVLCHFCLLLLFAKVRPNDLETPVQDWGMVWVFKTRFTPEEPVRLFFFQNDGVAVLNKSLFHPRPQKTLFGISNWKKCASFGK